jgi:hypothetical protein
MITSLCWEDGIQKPDQLKTGTALKTGYWQNQNIIILSATQS